jgi:LysR family nitrogen assimilation transcriptional regulator
MARRQNPRGTTHEAGMDLKQLAYFVHVAELGSFTRASVGLGVAQPALSRQVRALEVELRQTLFERTGRGVVPTEAGKRLLAHGRGILLQVERAKQDLEDRRGLAAGRFALGVPPSVSRMLSGPLVAAFAEALPHARLSVVEGLSTYVLEWLMQGRVDCAVCYNPAPSPALDLVPVLDEPLFLIGSRPANARRGSGRRPAQARGGKGRSPVGPGPGVGPPVAPAELARLPLVMPSRPHALRMLVESALAAEGTKAGVVLEIESVPAILDLAAAGAHHAVLSLAAVHAHGRADALLARPIGPPPLISRMWLATSAQRPRGPLIERGSALVIERLRALWQR